MLLVLFNPYIGAYQVLPLRGQSGPGSDGNEGVLRIPQSSCITGTSPSDCLVSYPGHSFGVFYSSAEVQSVYSTAPADWAIENHRKCLRVNYQINRNRIGYLNLYDKTYHFNFLFSSSSSCRAASTDILDPLSPLLPVVHRLWQVFRATSRILT